MADLSLLSRAIEEGNRQKAIELTNESLSTGMSPQDIIIHGLQLGMGVVGEKYSSGEYFVPEMLMAARAMDTALEVLRPSLQGVAIPTIGKVVIGTVEGDIHNIGKNVVATFLRGNGFEVFDLGVNVPVNKFIEEVRGKKGDILAMSSLLTTTMPMMSKVVKAMEEAGLRPSVKVIVGGAPVTQKYANYIGADAYARDGGKAVPECRRLLGKFI